LRQSYDLVFAKPPKKLQNTLKEAPAKKKAAK